MRVRREEDSSDWKQGKESRRKGETRGKRKGWEDGADRREKVERERKSR